MPTFKPDLHGFHFNNSDITWSLNAYYVGQNGIGQRRIVKANLYRSTALCGGMVYAALDFFNHKMIIPAMRTPPAEGTELHNYILNK